MPESDMVSYRDLSSFQLLRKQTELDDKLTKLYKCSGADAIINSLLTYKEAIQNEIDLRIASGKINKNTYFMIDEFYRQCNEIETARYKEEYELTRQRAAGILTENEFNQKIEALYADEEEKKNKIAETFNKNNR